MPDPFITQPGIYPAIAFADYHADPVTPAPSLSAGIACELVARTPFHAYLKHPRLNVEWVEVLELNKPEGNGRSRFGSLAHELLLGRGGGIHIIQTKYAAPHPRAGQPVDDYRLKAAQDERDDVIRQGATPCLHHELLRAEDVVQVIRDAIHRIPGCETAFEPHAGKSEVTVVWRDHLDVWGRCLIDYWGDDGTVYDLKTSTTDLSDEAIERKIYNDQLDLRAAWYLRGIAHVRPDLAGRIAYRYVFCQQKPPYELRVVELDPDTLMRGHKKAAYALRKWAYHLQAGNWPGYPPVIETMGLPRYAADRWQAREEFDSAVIEAINRDPFVTAFPSPEHPSPESAQLSEIAS